MKKNLRIYSKENLQKGNLTLSKKQSHYLKNVMRLKLNDKISIFNEKDGEWDASIISIRKNECSILIEKFVKTPDNFYDVWLLFAPIKQVRLDYLSQKSCEMGVKKLFPIFTEHTQVKKINIDRINSNLIEAAEQCNFNNIPEVSSAVNFNHILDNWEKFFEDRKVIFCDERSKSEALEVLKDKKSKYNNKWAIIVGPEGGFSDFERNSIDNKNNSLSISLGPRVMRSDTAVVAILAIFQMIIGDWKK